jgi:hypothetical protein
MNMPDIFLETIFSSSSSSSSELDRKERLKTEGRKDRKGLTPILLSDLCGLLFVSSTVAFEADDEDGGQSHAH